MTNFNPNAENDKRYVKIYHEATQLGYDAEPDAYDRNRAMCMHEDTHACIRCIILSAYDSYLTEFVGLPGHEVTDPLTHTLYVMSGITGAAIERITLHGNNGLVLLDEQR